ncbi:DUF4381 domain-containing protein [Puniceicoccales bacterium CK1056]|uniref:DUF4381 domain-containing protein n=1 Tax=Oceanipulchritudo coccoides TaxID=2706888 RepID=A0A6B2LYR1_9BACT|nr:DUF4381 family protein [Oceanipulchritudo coccoides]NDV61302.1 DUF4381 domain-containing protein [Oceanipulchritudo coccoides]
MEQFADIEGPLPIGLWPAILLIAGSILLILLSVIFIYWLLKRPRKENTASLEPTRSPLEIALERLQKLRSGKSQIQPEPFTVEVSDIVRDYLEEALAVPAREQTSEEFLNTLATRDGLPEILHRQMPAFLESCDMVKFARQSLDMEQQDALLETAKGVVESTDKELAARHPDGENLAQAI